MSRSVKKGPFVHAKLLARIMKMNETNEKRVGAVEKVLIDRIEGDYYIGRTQYDSPEVDDEILISVDEADLNVGDFVNVKLVKADYFDLYGNVIN